LALHIQLVGLNHRSAPVAVLERVSFTKEQLADALPKLVAQVGAGVILSTCNRTEIYTVSESPAESASQVRGFLTDYHHLPPETLSSSLYERTDADAARHLFMVASGLDAMIVGESQVLGQVRDALSVASESQSLQVPQVGLFHAAVRTGRRVREETDVGRNALSISYAGVKLAQRLLGTLEGQRVLLIGAGEAGRLVASALRTAGVGELMIANRTMARADELAQSLGGRVVPFLDIEDALSEADIVVSATDSPDYIVTLSMATAVVGQRRTGPLFFFDLAVPRDVDPEVASLDGARLYNIDDLSSIAEENLAARRHAAVEAESIVEQELTRFMTWWESLEGIPLIKEFRLQAEAIRERELERAMRRMPDLAREHREVVEALTKSLVNRLLHERTMSLRQGRGEDGPDEERDLFRLWGQP
jgi:glutamyl-tRNA reductase